jgi:hypothetical protein
MLNGMLSLPLRCREQVYIGHTSQTSCYIQNAWKQGTLGLSDPTDRTVRVWKPTALLQSQTCVRVDRCGLAGLSDRVIRLSDLLKTQNMILVEFASYLRTVRHKGQTVRPPGNAKHGSGGICLPLTDCPTQGRTVRPPENAKHVSGGKPSPI